MAHQKSKPVAPPAVAETEAQAPPVADALSPMAQPAVEPAEKRGAMQLGSPRMIPGVITLPDGTNTNLDLSTSRGKALAINAASPGELDFSDSQRDTRGQRYIDVGVVNYLCYPDQQEDPETGELKEFTRTCLIGVENEVWRTTSFHAPSRMRALMVVYTKEEWAAGITMRITERRSPKTGRTYHDFRIVIR